MKHVISKTGQGSLRRTKNISVRYTGPLPPPKFLRTNREWKWSQNRRAYDTPLALHLSCPDLCLYERTVDRAIVHHFAIRSNIKIFCNPNCVPRILIRKDLNFKKAHSSLIVRFWSVEKKERMILTTVQEIFRRYVSRSAPSEEYSSRDRSWGFRYLHTFVRNMNVFLGVYRNLWFVQKIINWLIRNTYTW